MFRCMLVLCASIVTGALANFEAQAACTASDFPNNVYVLPAGFKPQTTSGYQSPLTTAVSIRSSTGYRNYLLALIDAFNLAGRVAPFFQDHLCGLTAIFVTLDQCSNQVDCRENYSWGYRENPDQVGASGPFNRYIAISQGLLTNTPTLSNYYNALLDPLLGTGRAVASYSAANS